MHILANQRPSQKDTWSFYASVDGLSLGTIKSRRYSFLKSAWRDHTRCSVQIVTKSTYLVTIGYCFCCCCCCSHLAYWCQPEKTTLHGDQSRSWFAEQGKENKKTSLAAYPLPHRPHCSFEENKLIKSRDASTGYASLGRSRVRTRIPSARRLGQWVRLRKILHSRLR